MVLAAAVEEQTRKNRNLPKTLNMLKEVPKKPKMKFRAAKVIKFLLNFLQIKPKKKYGDKEKLCTISYIQDSFSSKSEVFECHPLLTSNPVENIQSREQSSKGLSMSWSYLVHDQFNEDVTDTGVCGVQAEDSEESGGIFYNESYFEDDYWQDYRGHDLSIRSPFVCGIQSPESFNQRLFEPEKTPCGEFKRNTRQETPRRRHASLPNLIVEKHPSNALPTKESENDIGDISKVLLDCNHLVFNYPPLSLNIAFDNLLDETTMCDVGHCSMNYIPMSFTELLNTEQCVERERENDQLMKYEKCDSSADQMTIRIPETLKNEGYTGSYNVLNSDITPEKFETAEICIYDHEGSSSGRGSDTSMPDSVTDDFLDNDVFGSETESSLDHCILDLVDPSLLKGKQVFFSESTSAKGSLKQQRSLDSGYKSADNVSPTSVPSFTTMLEAAVNDLNTEKPIEACTLDLPTETGAQGDVSLRAGIGDVRTASILHTPVTLSAKSATKIQTNTNPSTSSPIQIISTSLQTGNILTPISFFISPIRQNPEMPKIRCCTEISEGSTKRNSCQRQRYFLGDISPLPSRFNLDRYSILVTGSNELKAISRESDDLTNAANFIVNRIKFKEELKTDINMVELVEYLHAYYMAEVSKLSNKNIHTISDYRRFTKGSCDIFTSLRLTQENCFCEILTAILGNRADIVLACKDFIFKNFHVMKRQEFLQAPPELILMLLSNYHKTVLGPLGYPLGYRDSELQVKKALGRYLQVQRTGNLEKYLRVKRMVLCAINRKAVLQLGSTLADNNLSSIAFQDCHQGSESQSSEEFARASRKPSPCWPRRSVTEIRTWFDSLGEQKFQPSFRKLTNKSSSTLKNTIDSTGKSRDSILPDKVMTVFHDPPSSVEVCRISRITSVVTPSSLADEGDSFPVEKVSAAGVGARTKMAANSTNAENKGTILKNKDSDVYKMATAHKVRLFRSETFSGVTISLQSSLTEPSSMKLQHQKDATCKVWNQMGRVISTAV